MSVEIESQMFGLLLQNVNNVTRPEVKTDTSIVCQVLSIEKYHHASYVLFPFIITIVIVKMLQMFASIFMYGIIPSVQDRSLQSYQAGLPKAHKQRQNC